MRAYIKGSAGSLSQPPAMLPTMTSSTCPDCGGSVGRQPGVRVEGGAPVVVGWCDDCGRELRLRPGAGWESAHQVGGPWCW